MRSDLDLLADFTFDCWLLACAAHGACKSPVNGRVWERAIGDLLRFPDLPNRQRAGHTKLFGTPAASGIAHELDGCASGGGRTIVVECKSRASGATKADAALLHEKSLDFFSAKPQEFSRERWWRILVSSTTVSASVRAFSISLGIVLVEPGRLPLPVVLRTASRPLADMYLREPLLQDAVRLGEQAQLSLQERWVYDTDADEIRFKSAIFEPGEIQDLLWLQKELGSDILDLYDLYRSGALETRSEQLLRTLRCA